MAAALARGTAALTQAVKDARGELARAEELAKRRDGQASAGAKALAEALDRRLRETDREGDAVIQGMAEMKRAAQLLEGGLRDHAENIAGIARRPRWRPRLAGLAIGAASLVLLLLGAVLQRETGVVSLGGPRHERNDCVAEHYAPTLATCTSRARQHDRIIGCLVHVGPARGWTVSLYPDVNLEKVPLDESPTWRRSGKGTWSRLSRA